MSIILKVDQSGLSFNSWNTDVDCKGRDYSAEEKAKASTSSSTLKIPPHLQKIFDEQFKKRQQKNKK